jgi:hypothetical protein
MTRFVLPCGHKSDRLVMICKPVVVKAMVLAEHGESYYVNDMQVNASFSEHDLRIELFSKKKNNVAENVELSCPMCAKVCKSAEITKEFSCYRCHKYTDVMLCDHYGLYFCKKCVTTHCNSCAAKIK